MADDILDLILFILRKQDKITTRDDQLIHTLVKPTDETVTVQETSIHFEFAGHPVKYDDAAAIYGRCTYA